MQQSQPSLQKRAVTTRSPLRERKDIPQLSLILSVSPIALSLLCLAYWSYVVLKNPPASSGGIDALPIFLIAITIPFFVVIGLIFSIIKAFWSTSLKRVGFIALAILYVAVLAWLGFVIAHETQKNATRDRAKDVVISRDEMISMIQKCEVKSIYKNTVPAETRASYIDKSDKVVFSRANLSFEENELLPTHADTNYYDDYINAAESMGETCDFGKILYIKKSE